MTGDVLALTNQYTRLIMHEIDLDRQAFHVDDNAQKPTQVVDPYGREISVRVREEATFAVDTNGPGLSVEDIKREFGLESVPEYYRRLEEIRIERHLGASKQGSAALAP